jgi:NTP pyrophosphatase (non-canonical NTP hydrolase)
VKTIKEWQVEIRKSNAEHGWESTVTEENPGMFSEKMLLIISEISEALEEFRDHHGVKETYFKPENPWKPEGIPIELADAVIRILDFAEANGIDLEAAIKLKHEYNLTRPWKHGNKRI